MIRWKVVGGADKGGILVRDGCDLTSPKFAERLSSGAVVAQVELLEDRLHYKLQEGSGPSQGWVSLRISGKDLLVPAPMDLAERRQLAAAAAEARAGEEIASKSKAATTHLMESAKPKTASRDESVAMPSALQSAFDYQAPTLSGQSLAAAAAEARAVQEGPSGNKVSLAHLPENMKPTAPVRDESVAKPDDLQDAIGHQAPTVASPSLQAGGEDVSGSNLDDLLQKIYGVSKRPVEDSTLPGLDLRSGLEKEEAKMNIGDVFQEVGEVVVAKSASKASAKVLSAKGPPSASGNVLRVRLLDGKTVVSLELKNDQARVELLQEWLHKRQVKEAAKARWTPELVAEVQKGDWAIMNRSAFPPKELADESKTLAEEALSQGGQLSLVRAAGRGEVRQASHKETLLWRGYHGMGSKDWEKVRGDAQKRYNNQEAPVTPWRITLTSGEHGIVKGALVGKYTIFDHTGEKHKFQKAGMIIICHAPSVEAAKECHELALQLNFMVFSFPLLDYGMPADDDLCPEALVLHKVFEWFQQQTSLMVIKAVVGMGLSCASAVMQYAAFFQREAQRVALVLGPRDKGSRIACTWPDQDHLFENRHALLVYVDDPAIQLAVKNLKAVLPSQVLVERHISGSSSAVLWPSQASAALNDWLEGARRLDEGYSAATGNVGT